MWWRFGTGLCGFVWRRQSIQVTVIPTAPVVAFQRRGLVDLDEVL